MFKKILVPLDGSSLAERALPCAMSTARAIGAEVTLLRVIEPRPASSGEPVDSLEWEFQRAEARAYFAELGARLAQQGTAVRTETAEGRSAAQIIDTAIRMAADLIVMATHGQGEASDFRLGSTAQKIVASSPISILLVASDPAVPQSPPHVSWTRVLAPVDCSLRSRWGLSLAATIARHHGAELVLAHVIPIPEIPHHDVPVDEEGQELARRMVERCERTASLWLGDLARKLGAADLDVRPLVLRSTQVSRAIENLIAEEKPDLVVATAHGGGGARPAGAPWDYGMVAGDLIAHVTRPLLVLRDRNQVRRARVRQRAHRSPAPLVEGRETGQTFV